MSEGVSTVDFGARAYLTVQGPHDSDLARGAVHLEAVRAHNAVAQRGALGVLPLERVDYVPHGGVLEQHQALHVRQERRRPVAHHICNREQACRDVFSMRPRNSRPRLMAESYST